MSELDNKTYNQIIELCETADKYLDNDEFEIAIKNYQAALNLVPKPITNWEASTWILTAIGETYFFSGDFENALSALQQVMYCPDAIGNPLIHLRLGQVQLELGNEERAKDELARAYMGGSEDIFMDEDPKYLNFIKMILIH